MEDQNLSGSVCPKYEYFLKTSLYSILLIPRSLNDPLTSLDLSILLKFFMFTLINIHEAIDQLPPNLDSKYLLTSSKRFLQCISKVYMLSNYCLVKVDITF